MEPAREASNALIAAFERSSEALGRVRAALRGVIYGQDRSVDLALAALVAGGHALIVGAPGSAKTRLASALGHTLGLEAARAVFTPSLTLDDLAAQPDQRRAEDATGARRRASPALFSQLLLAEDLDRAAPAVRSALLEAVHEGTVRIGGETRPLRRPFHLIATRTPDAGFDLSETEADRFLVQIDMGAPDRGGERRLLIETTGGEPVGVPGVMNAEALLEAQRVAVELPVGEKVVEAILDLVRRARPDDPSAPKVVREQVRRGPGPRAGQALMRLARARALIDGRASPSADDVKALAEGVLKFRLTMQEGRSVGPVIEELVSAL